MKAENWILGVGAAFVIVLVGTAMVPDDFWNEDLPAVATTLADSAGAGGTAPPPLAVVRGRNVAMSGLTPFSRAESYRFDGRVVRIISRGADLGWGQVHVWIAGGPEAVREISLAPEWYLQYLSCAVSKNARVAGVAFRFDAKRPNAELYAKTVTVNGKTCRLRNDEGFALWSNKLR